MKININNLVNLELPREVICNNCSDDELFLAFGTKEQIETASLDSKYLCFTNEELSNNKYMICDLTKESLNYIIDIISSICSSNTLSIDSNDIYKIVEDANKFIFTKGESCDSVAACELAIKNIINLNITKAILHITYSENLSLYSVNEIIDHFKKTFDKKINLIFSTSSYSSCEEYIVSIMVA